MKILQLNKFFYPRGGTEKVMFETIDGLKERGHEVAEFSMKDPRNLPSDFENYFISALPELKSQMNIRQQWRIFKHLFFSNEVKERLSGLIGDFQPDLVHIHNAYHHLSASSFLTVKKFNLPTVLTVHDVFPLCPNHSLLKGETLGEEYLKNKIYNCVRYKCIDNKFLPSLAGTLEAYYYRLMKIWKNIDYYICPSQFMADKMAEYGFPDEKMRVVKNAFEFNDQVLPLGTKIVYLGRLHYEKGIKIFLESLKELGHYQVIIAGNGPEEKLVNEYIAKNRFNNVERVGWVSGDAWKRIMSSARIIVVPSVFLENCSTTILEALSYGRLVVATNRGGNSELIINGKTGFLCSPEDPSDLARAIKEAMELSDERVNDYINEGKKLVQENHNLDKYFDQLIKVYKEALGASVDKLLTIEKKSVTVQ